MKTEIIDTHCHLYSNQFQGDISEVMGRAEQEGVTRFYLPAIDSELHERMLALEDRFPGKCFAMMGLHPCSVGDEYENELRLIESWLGRRKFAALGEVGLDYYWDKTHIARQKQAFEMQIRWALDHDLPLVIHSRDSMDDAIAMIEQHQQGRLRGIFHCFTGTAEQAAKIIAVGFLLGIGGVVTFRNSGVAEVIRTVPAESLVLETDAPYLAPVPFRGKRNESAYLPYILHKVAEARGESPELVASHTTANAKKLFGH